MRLNTDDVALVEMWMSETDVSLSYTDFPEPMFFTWNIAFHVCSPAIRAVEDR